MQNGYAAYRHTAIDTADQGKLILIAYDVAIRSCRQAIEKFEGREHMEERTKHLFKAQDAITELLSALKLDVGDVAVNLYNLYDYILHALVEAGVRNNKGKVEEVLGYLETLRSAWDEAIRKLRMESAPLMQAGNLAVQG